ncbi:hypothetical protein [Actinomadura mexicana]|nr:hypothetical protein [Actinomadura mexicana]
MKIDEVSRFCLGAGAFDGLGHPQMGLRQDVGDSISLHDGALSVTTEAD